MPAVADVLKALESDYNERNYEDKYVSQDDVRFIQFLSDNIKQEEDGHYQTPLPFKSDNSSSLPNDKRLAPVQLQDLKRKLSPSKQYHDQYTAFMEEKINRGNAELALATSI